MNKELEDALKKGMGYFDASRSRCGDCKYFSLRQEVEKCLTLCTLNIIGDITVSESSTCDFFTKEIKYS